MKKISKNELLAILAAAGVTSGSAVLATNLDQNNDINALGKVEHAGATFLGDESSCGKGSCGKDEKGAQAAKEKRAKKEVKKTAKKAEKKEAEKKEEKSDKK